MPFLLFIYSGPATLTATTLSFAEHWLSRSFLTSLTRPSPLRINNPTRNFIAARVAEVQIFQACLGCCCCCCCYCFLYLRIIPDLYLYTFGWTLFCTSEPSRKLPVLHYWLKKFIAPAATNTILTKILLCIKCNLDD
jgi:hypothetical protein